MQYQNVRRIGEILLESKLINPVQFQAALKKKADTDNPPGQVYIEMGFVSEEQLVTALSKRLKLPVLDVENIKIPDDFLHLFSVGFLSKRWIVPVSRNGNSIRIAMANPLNYAAIRDIQFMMGADVEPMVATHSDIKYLLETKFVNGFDMKEVLPNLKAVEQVEVLEEEEDKGKEAVRLIQKAGQAAPIVNLVNKILIESIKSRASDIHIEPRLNVMLIRNRIDGLLRTVTSLPIKIHAPVISRIKIMSKIDISEHRRPLDGGAKIKLGKREIDLRISTLPTQYGEKMVIRILEKSQKLVSLEDLGMYPRIKEQFSNLLRRPQGIILVTGPTGSGKSTTLYAAISVVHSEELNIITIEDPVEYSIPGVNQVQVNEKAGITFASGLRSILRQDPNVIMVGEIRDRDTAEIAFQASMTGHLVFSTLHTNNAVSAITRLTDIGIEPYLLASSLVGVVAQRLIRRNCPHCLHPYMPDSDLLEKFKILPEDAAKIPFHRGEGCRKCNFVGYSGRIGLFETLKMNNKIKNLITSGAGEKEIFMTARRAGMNTMEENGLHLVFNKSTTPEEVLRVIPPEEISIKKKSEWINKVNNLFN